MKNKVSILLASLMLITVPMIFACTKAPESPAPVPTAPASPAAPKVINWRMQDIATPGQIHYNWRGRFVKNVEKMSGGRLVITQYPSGALIQTTEIFDSLKAGAIDIAYDAATYWSGKIGPVAQLGWAVPYAWEDPRELDNWILGEYSDVMRKIYARNGIYYLSPTLSSSYPIISTKPIKTLADLAKLKIRSTGLTASVLAEVGARTVFAPAEELYTGLATGVFDGVTWGGPSQTDAMGLADVCKYYLLPPVAPVTYGEIIINAKAWESLTPDLQEIVRVGFDQTRWPTYKEMVTLDETLLRDYQLKRGVTVTQMPPEDVDKMRAAAVAVMDREIAAKDTEFGAPIIKSLKENLKALGYMK